MADHGGTSVPEAGGAQATPGADGGVAASRERGIDRVLQLLAFLHGHGRAIRVGDLARQLSAPRSSTYEIVRTLTEAGILEAGPDGSIFFGKVLYFYGTDYLREHDVVGRGRDEVDRLARETGETSQLCMLHNGRYTVVHMRAGSRPFRISSEIGIEVPVPWTASGRLLLAGMSDAEIARFLKPSDLVMPNGDAIDLGQFIASVRTASAQGFCVTSGIVDAFTRCVAAPILDHAGQTTATICFVVPVDTAPDRVGMLRDLLVESGRMLSIYPKQRA